MMELVARTWVHCSTLLCMHKIFHNKKVSVIDYNTILSNDEAHWVGRRKKPGEMATCSLTAVRSRLLGLCP